jgi:cytochrome P450
MEEQMPVFSTVHTGLKSRPPGPRGHEVIKMIYDIWHDPLYCFVNASNQYGDIVSAHFRGSWFFVSHPDYIKHILHDNNRNYRKGLNYAPLKSLTGEGLLTSDGEYWLRQRRLVQPAFHHKHIEALSAIIGECTVEMLQSWRAFSKLNMLFDIELEMHRLVMHIIGRILFSMNIVDQAHMVAQAHAICIEHITHRIKRFEFPPESWPTPGNRRFQKALQPLNIVIQSIITERRNSGSDTGDLLSILLRVYDQETNQCMTDQELRDELISILLAGFETTANALCWLWYVLSTHPHVRQNLWTELTSILGGRPPTAQDLPRLIYARKVIDETLRLYPPVWLTSRTPLQNDEIGHYAIPAGSTILFSPMLPTTIQEYGRIQKILIQSDSRRSSRKSGNATRICHSVVGRTCVSVMRS